MKTLRLITFVGKDSFENTILAKVKVLFFSNVVCNLKKTVNSSQLKRCRNICVNEIPAPLLYWLDGALAAKNNYRTEQLTLNTHRQMASSRV